MSEKPLVVTPTGARICLRPREIGTVYHRSVAQRKAEQAFNRAFARARKADHVCDEVA